MAIPVSTSAKANAVCCQRTDGNQVSHSMPFGNASRVPLTATKHFPSRSAILKTAGASCVVRCVAHRPARLSVPPALPMIRSLVTLLLFVVLLPGTGLFAADAAAAKIDFNRDIRPILSNQCAKCHGPDAKERKGGTDGLRLDVREDALGDLGGYAAIVPGQPGKSELIKRILSTDDDERMPPKGSGKKLTQREIDLLKQWIEQGAEYAQHWSYVKPMRPALPAVKRSDWARNEIDYFILERLERERLSPSEEADRFALMRRAALDLTGLPPAWE